MGGLTGADRTAGMGAAPVASPCTGVCRIGAATGRCDGCARTLDEIAAWGGMSPVRRATIMAALPARATG